MKSLITICLCLVAVATPQVKATAYGFKIFQNDDGVYMDVSELGISVDVTEHLGTGIGSSSGNILVSFKFKNDVLIDSSITNVYFDAVSLQKISGIKGSDPGVVFKQGGSPAELPGASGLDPDFITNLKLSVSADSLPNGTAHNGVDTKDEWLEIIFELKDGVTFADVIAQLDAGVAGGEDNLRIGLKIQSLPDESSASAVNTPEPATIILLGISGLALLRKRQR